MQISDLKRGLFGYRRESVYQYISSLNEEFTKKLLEKDARYTDLVQRLRERDETLGELRVQNESLRQERDALQREAEEVRVMRLAVSDAIIQAQLHAAQLRQEAEALEAERREQLDAELQAQREQMDTELGERRRELAAYADRVTGFRDQLHTLLRAMDDQLGAAEERAAELDAAASVLCQSAEMSDQETEIVAEEVSAPAAETEAPDAPTAEGDAVSAMDECAASPETAETEPETLLPSGENASTRGKVALFRRRTVS